MRAAEPVLHARRKTVTMISAIGPGGPAGTLAFKGALDGPAFAAFCDTALKPALRPGNVVVADNLSADAAAARALEFAGATLRFLPPYSPDLNPIEHMWSTLRSPLRSAAARSALAIYDALGPALATVTAADCRAWFRGCGHILP